VTNLITVSNGMESNSPGDVMKDEDSRLKDIQEMVCVIRVQILGKNIFIFFNKDNNTYFCND
jgi:hypothetical protein